MELDKGIVQKIRDHFVNAGKTLAVAESVTSGNIQAALSQAKDASLFFQGGITTYNLGQKYKHLAVEPIHAESCMCVSAKVAEEMATNVCVLFGSDYGVGITGFASVQPEKGVHELFAFFAIAAKGKILLSEKVKAENTDSQLVQLFFTNQLLQRLSDLT